MIELNLLPDVKQTYIKAERSRRLVISVSVIAIIATVALLVLLLSASALQKKHMGDLSDDIKKYSEDLKGKREISKILTVQNQLTSLTALHEEKPAASRTFDYLNQLTPTDVDISSFKLDFTANTISITGNATSLSAVNKYIDTIKFTTYQRAGENSSQKAFSNVVLTSFGISGATAAPGAPQNAKPATYTIDLNYEPTLFDITAEAKLSVPSKVTTRSNTDSSNELFKDAPVKQNTR